MDLSNIRVVVVDDERVVCSNVSAFMEDEGFSVSSATSGEEALNLISRQKFDIAIVDMRLPGIDGETVILRAHDIQPLLKFLIHTGSTNYSVSRSLEEIGITDKQVFRKPIADMSVLSKGVINLLKGKL
jgi:DNA-binding NtrC family response regulator